MSTTDQLTDFEADSNGTDASLTLELNLQEAEALRTWLLKATADGSTSLDTPLVNEALTKLARVVDTVQAAGNVRRELQQVGLDVSHLSDDEVRELGRRVSEAAVPGIRA